MTSTKNLSMPSSNKTTRDLDSLDREIRRLQRRAKQLEDKIDENFTYFQEHSGSLFVRSLLPRRIEGEAVTGYKVLDTILQNERLQKSLIQLADHLAEKLGDGLNWLVNRVFRK
jgi:hypothetical protein